MTGCVFAHRPEMVVFAIDLDEEMASEATPSCSRYEAVVHAITTFVSAKKRVDGAHTFGLMTLLDSAVFLPDSVTSSLDQLLAALRALAPAGRHAAFDMASLLHAAEEAQAHARRRGALLRVLMVYGRSSCVPRRAPAAAVAAAGGLALDCIYLHDKPQAGLNNPQDVYSALEETVDDVSAAAGHNAYISEASGSNVKKLLSTMAMMTAHPLQRPPQLQLPPALDLAAAPIALLPSERAPAAPAPSPPPTPPSASPAGGPGYAAAAAGRASPAAAAAAAAAAAPGAPAPAWGAPVGTAWAAAPAAAAPDGAGAGGTSAAAGAAAATAATLAALGADPAPRPASGSHPIPDLLHLEDSGSEQPPDDDRGAPPLTG